MWRLTASSPDDRERGATAIMVALLMVVLMGAGAFVVDVGALYAERRELQNGADAGALAVAEDCAWGDCGSYLGTAGGLADANAEDAAHTVDDVVIDMTEQTVTVDTSTEDPDGGSLLPFSFARVLGATGSTVHARAVAQWGALQAGPTVPLIISQCDWRASGGTLGDPDADPVVAPGLPGGLATMIFHDGNSANDCDSTSGQDIPGGFGWLDTDGACEVTAGAGWTLGADPGANPPLPCDPEDFWDSATDTGRKIRVPVFYEASGVEGQGQKGFYRVWGLATFEVTGMRLNMGNKFWTAGDVTTCVGSLPSVPGPPADPGKGGGTGGNSSADQACLVGRFVEDVDLTGDIGDGPDLGTVAVRLIA